MKKIVLLVGVLFSQMTFGYVSSYCSVPTGLGATCTPIFLATTRSDAVQMCDDFFQDVGVVSGDVKTGTAYSISWKHKLGCKKVITDESMLGTHYDCLVETLCPGIDASSISQKFLGKHTHAFSDEAALDKCVVVAGKEFSKELKDLPVGCYLRPDFIKQM